MLDFQSVMGSPVYRTELARSKVASDFSRKFQSIFGNLPGYQNHLLNLRGFICSGAFSGGDAYQCMLAIHRGIYNAEYGQYLLLLYYRDELGLLPTYSLTFKYLKKWLEEVNRSTTNFLSVVRAFDGERTFVRDYVML